MGGKSIVQMYIRNRWGQSVVYWGEAGGGGQLDEGQTGDLCGYRVFSTSYQFHFCDIFIVYISLFNIFFSVNVFSLISTLKSNYLLKLKGPDVTIKSDERLTLKGPDV